VWALLAATLLIGAAAQAETRLPHVFGSHMVLQRDREIPVWGWAEPGEDVTVRLGAGPAVATKADATGKWSLRLPAIAAGGPFTLTVTGRNQVAFEDLLVGEVWVCSGQSNMEWPLAACTGAEAEIATADHPQLRQLKVPNVPSGYPADDFEADWRVCTPQTAASFTGVGYFFAKRLMQELKVPVGLINTSWSGTAIEPWTPPVGFARVPSLDYLAKQVALTDPRSDGYKQALTDYLAQDEAWLKTAREALATEKPLAPAPEYPAGLRGLEGSGSPSTLYHGMVHPLLPFAIRGAIWYQGEANRGDGMRYAEKTEALVGGWRQLWGQGDFPFYYVQIAPHVYGNEDPYILPGMWEGQTAAQRIPNTGMVVIHDVGDLNDIHPKNKLDVGERLARLALARTYGQTGVVDSGPTFRSLTIEGDKLRVRFDNVGGGLTTRDGKAPDWFEIIGTETDFVKADATIDSDAVLLSAAGVGNPVAMRFGWHRNASPNLMNKEGLPAGACRAGEVPQRDYLALNVAEAKEYELVYSLDLSKAGATIPYDVDRRDQVTKPFDRVAYFLELQKGGEQAQWVYVSMDAFTADLAKIGVPTFASKAVFQQKVTNLNVISNVAGIATGTGLKGGVIEFWPHNYGPDNGAGVPGASSAVWDFGDSFGPPEDGYGSMQVGNSEARQTIFAFNNWKSGGGADLGIGNGSGDNPDWTFASNAASYSVRSLRVLVRPRK
jgi:sialate O-acetylesterase